MYCVYWSDNSSYELIGALGSVLILANMLENMKIEFQVADTKGYRLNQNQLGCGGFKYWKHVEH